MLYEKGSNIHCTSCKVDFSKGSSQVPVDDKRGYQCPSCRAVVCKPRPQFVNISGHTRDTCWINGEEYNHGYVPRGLAIGGGDDIELKVDIATGKIVGWEPERWYALLKAGPEGCDDE